MKFPPINPKCPHMLHGGDYNPDQWIRTPEIWDEDMRLMIAEMPPGSKALLKIVRDGGPATVEVVLGTLAGKPNELLAGVNAGRLTDEIRRKFGIDARVNGLLITDVDSASPYADHLAPAMVVMEINRTSVADLTAARALLQRGRNLLFVYYRGATGFLVLTVR